MGEVIVRRNYGPSGPATVRVMKNGVRVEFDDGDVYDVSEGWRKELASGKYVISLSQDKSRIVGIRAAAGQYVFQFKQMGNRTVGKVQGSNEPGLPTNKVQKAHMVNRRDGKGRFLIPDQLVFTVEVEIVQGPYAGLTSTSTVPYSFTAPASGQFTAFADAPKNLERLENFLRASTGQSFMNIDVPFDPEPPTLLLRFEKYILAHRIPFLGNSDSKGFLDLDSLSPLPADLWPKAKKAPAKKATKK